MSQSSLQTSHTPEAIRQRLRMGVKHSYLKDFIYGAIDGTVTTFAVVSGVAGAQLSAKIILILGIANLIGDGFSMAVSNFLGTRAEEQMRKKARQEEETHIMEFPEGEKEEIRQIFKAKGFQGADLEKIIKVITSDPKQWVDTMLQEELGLPLSGPSPVKAGLSTFMAFVLIGLIPLLPFIVGFFDPHYAYNSFIISVCLTAVAFFIVGALKSSYVDQNWIWSGLETLFAGGCAAVLAYGAGFYLKDIIGG